MKVPQVAPWVPVAGVALAGFALLVYIQHANDPESTSWTNPDQPPEMVAPQIGASGARTGSTRPPKTYPGSLASWSGCVVGDC